jgi:hypothetical protein
MPDLTTITDLRTLVDAGQRHYVARNVGGYHVACQRSESKTGERIYHVEVARFHIEPNFDDMQAIGGALGAPASAEWMRHAMQRDAGEDARLHRAWCKWFEI